MKLLSNIAHGIENLGRAWRGEPQLLHTPFGTVQLARGNRRQAQRILTQLNRTTDHLTKRGTQDWRRAHQLALSVESPNRQLLYDIYRDAELDGHLSGCVEQRHGFVMAKAYNIENKDNTPQDDLKHYFMQPWFDQLCHLILSANEWGHSLIELGDIVTDGDGCPCYENVRLIDRKYVIPEYHRVITDLGMDWQSGIDYHDPRYCYNLIEAGEPDNLGLYLKAAQYTIPKKTVLASWDVFAEIFGMPMRVATTASQQKAAQDEIAQMLASMGESQWMLLPAGTEFQIVESSKSDAYNVYNERVNRSNSEISKLVIGQTMTIEDGSSLSQSQTHLKVLQNLVEGDAKRLSFVINNQLIPRMIRHGFPLQGMHFAWDESIDYTPEQQMEYEKMIADRYEVDGQYFADKYNMPVGERIRQSNPFDIQPNGNNDNKDQKDNGHQKNFFD